MAGPGRGAGGRCRSAALGALAALLVLAGACSPEAARSRSGGPGADIGNHSRELPEPSTAPTPSQR